MQILRAEVPETRKPQTVGYARVSTDDQTTALQLAALEGAGCSYVWEDSGLSGVARKRPGLEKALRSLQAGDVLVVWRLDRLGRSLKDLIEIVNQIKEKGAGFRSLNEAIDTTTPGGRLIFHIFGAIAEFEREVIRDRVVAGIETAKARGQRFGRPFLLDQAKVKHFKILLENGESVASLARAEGIDKATVYRALARYADMG